MNVTEQHKSVYVYIGQRIKERRKLLRLSQTQLADLMGFSYQQMQKYETGVSHVTAGKLLLFAKILNVSPSYFYEGLKLDEAIGKRIDTDIIQKTRTEPLRILLVEDNTSDVFLFNKAINTYSEMVDVYTIHDSEKVMDFLQNHEAKWGKKSPNIVILDLSMPKIGGLDLLKLIKKNPKTLMLPVLILTNSISTRDLIEVYKAGASGFIQKSVDLDDYIETLETVVKYWSKIVALPHVN